MKFIFDLIMFLNVINSGLDRDFRRYFCFDGDGRVFVETKKSNYNVTSTNTIYLSNGHLGGDSSNGITAMDRNGVENDLDSQVKVEPSESGSAEDAQDQGTPTTVTIDPTQLLAFQNNRAMKRLVTTKPAMKKTSW